MFKTIDLLSVQKALDAGACGTVHHTHFTNVVNEYVFRKEHNWFVDFVIPYNAVTLSDENIVRVARVHVMKNQRRCYYFYVVAMTSSKALHLWELLGVSALMSGSIRGPDYETEMKWFWRPPYRWNTLI